MHIEKQSQQQLEIQKGKKELLIAQNNSNNAFKILELKMDCGDKLLESKIQKIAEVYEKEF